MFFILFQSNPSIIILCFKFNINYFLSGLFTSEIGLVPLFGCIGSDSTKPNRLPASFSFDSEGRLSV
mgnify:CR=1 FL=1